MQQARAVAEVLAETSPYIVLSSDLARALVTAEAIAARAGTSAVADERLREISLGGWEGLTVEEARERFPEEYAAWVAGEDKPRGGGETYRQAAARATECLREVIGRAPDGATVIAVTHGGTARAALGGLLDLDPADWWRIAPLGNTCWSVLVEGERGWRLERHNTGLGPLVGAAMGAHDLGSRPVGGQTSSPDVEPVK
jgi:probable phosphoglycerate mutase